VSQQTTPFTHFWEECVGSGHALLGLRADWQDHLATAHNDLGFKRVRFHGLFDDDMSALLIVDNEVVFSWYNIDTVFDFIVSLGMMPYVELSFMPEFLANGTTTIMHYKAFTSPPNNWTLWEDFITAFGEHIISRYGMDEVSQWTFEVWNEPNCGFFNGDQAQYFQFYQRTATALKAANSSLRVGGPVTCMSAWLTEFIDFCEANNAPYDFIATHEYPTDIVPSNRNIMKEVFTKSRGEVGADTLLFYSEYNDGLYSDPAYHDTPYASSYLFHVLHDTQGLVDLLSWWTFTDIFEEQGQTSNSFFTSDGWGLLNIYKVPKPAYRAFELLHNLGTEEIPVTTATNSSVGVYAVLSTNGSSVDVVIYNFDLPLSPLQNETVNIQVTGFSGALPKQALLFRIDDQNANAPAVWASQGYPEYPTQEQIQAQLQASMLTPEVIPVMPASEDSVTISLVIPPWGSAVVTFTL
jgi:xylan 1,4-beta-xylosidase